MAMVRELMAQRHIAENMLATAGGERRLTDILHISELLQEAGTQLESEHAPGALAGAADCRSEQQFLQPADAPRE